MTGTGKSGQPTSTSPATATTTAPQTGDCHPAYEPCLPNLAGDALNCGDLTSAQRPVRVKKIGVDPYRLDRATKTATAANNTRTIQTGHRLLAETVTKPLRRPAD